MYKIEQLEPRKLNYNILDRNAYGALQFASSPVLWERMTKTLEGYVEVPVIDDSFEMFKTQLDALGIGFDEEKFCITSIPESYAKDIVGALGPYVYDSEPFVMPAFSVGGKKEGIAYETELAIKELSDGVDVPVERVLYATNYTRDDSQIASSGYKHIRAEHLEGETLLINREAIRGRYEVETEYGFGPDWEDYRFFYYDEDARKGYMHILNQLESVDVKETELDLSDLPPLDDEYEDEKDDYELDF